MEEKIDQNLPAEPSNDFYQNRLIQIILLVTVCLFLGLIDGFRSYVSSYHNGRFFAHLSYVMRWDISGWLIWVGFIPLIIWLCRRFPVTQNNWLKRLAIFLPIGLVMAFARTLFPALIHILFLEGFADLQEWLPDKFYILVTDFIVAFSFYLLVLSFGQAITYSKQLQNEELRTIQLEAQLSRAELNALKMQLHPHFLFNVLNSIAALQLENPKAAQEMTVRLGDFLRMTLENVGVQEVTLEKEIEMLKCYLDIEKIRFGNRLTTKFSISPDAFDCQIPNLILQPIVENAIRHGIAPLTIEGRIDINAYRENGWLKVEIQDNGQGIDNKDEIFLTGVGLSNAQARLKQSYGENFRFDFDSSKNGLLVTLRLPIQKIQAKER